MQNNSSTKNTAVGAISIRQPAAAFILHRGKDIENRSHPSLFKGNGEIFSDKPRWVLVHAGQARQKPEPTLSREILKKLGYE